MSSRALSCVEVTDHIVAFLASPDCATSTSDVRACSLVSFAFAGSSQRWLFHHIQLPPACQKCTNTAIRSQAACSRLLAVLDDSPWLGRYIRFLTLTITRSLLDLLPRLSAALPCLQHLAISNLDTRNEDVRLHILPPIAQLVGRPTLRTLELLQPVFEDVQDLHAVFSLRDPGADLARLVLDGPRVFKFLRARKLDDAVDDVLLETDVLPGMIRVLKSTSLKLNLSRWDGWLAHPLCPLDFSGVRDLELHGAFGVGLRNRMRHAWGGITRLAASAYSLEAAIAEGFSLRQLPCLHDLFLHTANAHISCLSAIIGTLGEENAHNLSHLALEVGTVDQLVSPPQISVLVKTLNDLPCDFNPRIELAFRHLTVHLHGPDGVRWFSDAVSQLSRILIPKLGRFTEINISCVQSGTPGCMIPKF
ncbi:unnamed protein product [Mycena citricolor]|uniref:Uncharacterized protein n=1 Tax=Mycena citricolor TaxID=2018698 RepID=A0AAD2Q7J1_9AGAR|nr:unnamed protein product [Mycena citricolor]